jgi:hypothetical protein
LEFLIINFTPKNHFILKMFTILKNGIFLVKIRLIMTNFNNDNFSSFRFLVSPEIRFWFLQQIPRNGKFLNSGDKKRFYDIYTYDIKSLGIKGQPYKVFADNVTTHMMESENVWTIQSTEVNRFFFNIAHASPTCLQKFIKVSWRLLNILKKKKQSTLFSV